MRRLSMVVLIASVMAISVASIAKAGVGGYWYSLEEGLSVKTYQVERNFWSWSFRNDGNTTIAYMQYMYIDKDGEHWDVVPYPLKPGAVVGGWTAFSSSSEPTFRIVEIKRR